MNIRKLWVAEVRPAFMGVAGLALVADEQRHHGLFVVKHDQAMAQIGPFDRAPTWIDPVGRMLQALDLWPDDSRVALDGVSYTSMTYASGTQGAIQFTSPATPSLGALERGLLLTAEMLVARDRSAIAAKYLRDWAAYTLATNHATTRAGG